MARLDELPAEVIGAIAESLYKLEAHDKLEKPSLLNFVLTCRLTHDAAIPCLYKTFNYHGSKDHRGRHLQNYILALRNTLSGQSVREIILKDWYWSAIDDVWLYSDLATSSEICTPDTLGFSLFQLSTNLRKLVVDYPPDGTFLNVFSPTVQELHVRPVHRPWEHTPGERQAIDYPIDGPLRVDFVPYVLKWPRLEYLSLEATTIHDDESIYSSRIPVEPRSSSVTHLTLKLGNFSALALSHVCNALTALKTFTYVPTTKTDVADDELDIGSEPDQLPRNSEVAQDLLPHAESLNDLTLARAGGCWTERLDKVGSLQSFTALTSLQIDATMLLGWNHCEHNSASNQSHYHTAVDASSPWLFGTMLPPQIKKLTVVTDHHLSQQQEEEYLFVLVEGIIAEIASGRLLQLQRLCLERSNCQYCWLCMGYVAGPDPRRLHLQVSEKDRLLEKLSRMGCEFRVAGYSDF